MTGSTNAYSQTDIDIDKLVNDIAKLIDNQTKKILETTTPIDTLVKDLVDRKLNSGVLPLDKLIDDRINKKLNSGDVSLDTMIDKASRVYSTNEFKTVQYTVSGNRQNKAEWVHNSFNGKGKITLFINNKDETGMLPSIYYLEIDGADALEVLNEGESSIDKLFAQSAGKVEFTFESSFDIVIPDTNNVSYLLQTV